jgi:hypothetical protein
MPIGARLLTVAVQHNEPQIWALVDPDGALVERRVLTAGTGHPIEGRPPYVASYQLLDGALVFHVFDGGEDYADVRPPAAPRTEVKSE